MDDSNLHMRRKPLGSICGLAYQCLAIGTVVGSESLDEEGGSEVWLELWFEARRKGGPL